MGDGGVPNDRHRYATKLSRDKAGKKRGMKSGERVNTVAGEENVTRRKVGPVWR